MCDELGHDQLNNLAMSYRKADGSFGTVTRGVTIAELRESPMLRLAPSSAAPQKARAKGRSRRA